MKLHVFNPEHDIALAANLSNFTSPRAGRELRRDLAWLPSLWADDGDWVLTDNKQAAVEQLKALPVTLKDVRLIDKRELKTACENGLPDGFSIEPWGWDKAICHELVHCGVPESLLPSTERLESIRKMSHRGWAAEHLLPHIIYNIKGTVGSSTCVKSAEEVEESFARMGRCVVKSPWSSSGRGVRFIENASQLAALDGWIRNVIEHQGSIMVEPMYRKIADFAMEFRSTENGVEYQGLSVFSTKGTAYTGNLIATEAEKMQMLSRHIPAEILENVKNIITDRLSPVFKDSYTGSFGIDMMIVSNPQPSTFIPHPSSLINLQPSTINPQPSIIHPCIELNLRQTMGYAALRLSEKSALHGHHMQIVHKDSYRLVIE